MNYVHIIILNLPCVTGMADFKIVFMLADYILNCPPPNLVTTSY